MVSAIFSSQLFFFRTYFAFRSNLTDNTVNETQSCCQHRLHLPAHHTAIEVHILMRTIFCIRCLHAEQLRESLHVGQDILNKSEKKTRLVVKASTMSVARLFGSCPPKTASPSKEMDSLFFTFTLSLDCFLALLHGRLMTLDTCTPSHARHLEDENARKWQAEA